MDAADFGAFLKACRIEQNLTQAQLAERLHVTAKAVSRWERGVGFPDIHTLEPLAQALDVSLLELMQSRRIREDTVTSQDASAAMANTLAMMKRANEASRRSPLGWIYSVFFAVPLFLTLYIVRFHVESDVLQATAYVLLYFQLYMFGDLSRTVILQQQNPGRSFLSARWPFLAATVAKFLGYLLVLFSFVPLFGRKFGAFWALFGCGGLLSLGAWLCFEFWKDYPLEEKDAPT